MTLLECTFLTYLQDQLHLHKYVVTASQEGNNLCFIFNYLCVCWASMPIKNLVFRKQ